MKESAVDWTDASVASHIRCHHLWSPGSTLTLRPGSPYNWKIVPLYHFLPFPPTPVPRRPPFDSLSMRLIFFFFMILPIIDRNGEGNGRYLCLNISHTKVSSSFIHAVAKGFPPFKNWVIFLYNTPQLSNLTPISGHGLFPRLGSSNNAAMDTGPEGASGSWFHPLVCIC